jgi:hypothetical protein
MHSSGTFPTLLVHVELRPSEGEHLYDHAQAAQVLHVITGKKYCCSYYAGMSCAPSGLLCVL